MDYLVIIAVSGNDFKLYGILQLVVELECVKIASMND